MKRPAFIPRTMLILPMTCLGISMFSNHVVAVPTVLDTVFYAPSGRFLVLLGNSNWTDAEAAAIQLGGHLVTVSDPEENAFIFNRWGDGRNLWIGLNDVAVEGTFVWASGDPGIYRNWRFGEPNDGNTGEDFAYILGNNVSNLGIWNDGPNVTSLQGQFPFYGVAEVPEPSAVALFGAAGLLLFGLWRYRASQQRS